MKTLQYFFKDAFSETQNIKQGEHACFLICPGQVSDGATLLILSLNKTNHGTVTQGGIHFSIFRGRGRGKEKRREGEREI